MPAVQTFRVYPSISTVASTCRVFPSPPHAVRACMVNISQTSAVYIDVRRVYPSPPSYNFLGQCRKQSGTGIRGNSPGTGICRPSSMPVCSGTRLGCQMRKCRCPPLLFGGIAVPNANGKVWDRLVGLVHCKGTIPKILNKCTPRKGIAQPQFQFPHSCVCEPFVYSHNRSACSAAEK